MVGLLSGLVGNAGLLGAATFLSLNSPPVAYVASEATTAVAMRLSGGSFGQIGTYAPSC